ncbi:MAG TPA: Gfo/Idh/MocA family oxidoreductase [Candidatus Limnocylindria bacterium]|nr:Gfo/Idh/MocA family oxidoreductase [Candidatus Limnocylindria bacterium]
MASAIMVGLGHQALSEHIPALLRRKDIRIVGACDPNPDARALFLRLFPELAPSVPTYDNLRELLDKTRPTMAIIAVPHDCYLDIIRDLCRRRIYFLKEKPLARNLSEAQTILAIPGFAKYGFIATQRRHSSLYQKAQLSLKDLGKPYLFTAVYKLNIESPHAGWRGSAERAGGGCLIDMGYHIIDQMLWWFGMPQELTAHISALAVPDATYDAEDTATISFQYQSGMHGVILLSRAAGEKREEYSVYGQHGYLEGTKRRLAIYDRHNYQHNHIDHDAAEAMNDAQLDFFINRVQKEMNFIDVQQQHLENMRFIARCLDPTLEKLSVSTVSS